MNSNNIFDTGPGSFELDVIAASHEQLVMVDFWADWCGPCKSLAPILDGLVAQFGGNVKLAKVDTDKHQDLAGQFGIRSLPTVVFFHQGKAVDQFMGVQPESAIRSLIEKYVIDEAGKVLGQIITLYEAGEIEAAIEQLAALVSEQPENDDARLTLVRWLIEPGRIELARELMDGVSEQGRSNADYKSILAQLEFAGAVVEGPETQELLDAIERDGSDLEARFKLANRLIADQQLPDALDHLLEIIRQKRNFRDNEPRQTILKVFALCGGQGELVSKYRSRLASALN